MFDNVFSFYVIEPCWFMGKDIWQYALMALLMCAIGSIFLRLSGRGCVGLSFIGLSIDFFLRKPVSYDAICVNILLLIYGITLFAFAVAQRCLKKEKTPLGKRCLKGIVSVIISTLLIMPFVYYYKRGLTMSAYGGVNFTLINVGGAIMILGIIFLVVLNILQLIKPFKKPLLPLTFGNAVFWAGYFILTFTGIPSLWDRILSFLICCAAVALTFADIKKDIGGVTEN